MMHVLFNHYLRNLFGLSLSVEPIHMGISLYHMMQRMWSLQHSNIILQQLCSLLNWSQLFEPSGTRLLLICKAVRWMLNVNREMLASLLWMVRSLRKCLHSVAIACSEVITMHKKVLVRKRKYFFHIITELGLEGTSGDSHSNPSAKAQSCS